MFDRESLARMAELLKVDELVRYSTIREVIGFVIRVLDVKERVEIDLCDTKFTMETVTKTLFDAAARVRLVAARNLVDRAAVRDVDWQPLQVLPGEKAMLDWMDYQTRAVSSALGLSSELLVVPDPAMPAGSFEIRGASQTVRVINVGEPSPAGRFAAIAEELKNT